MIRWTIIALALGEIANAGHLGVAVKRCEYLRDRRLWRWLAMVLGNAGLAWLAALLAWRTYDGHVDSLGGGLLICFLLCRLGDRRRSRAACGRVCFAERGSTDGKT